MGDIASPTHVLAADAEGNVGKTPVIPSLFLGVYANLTALQTARPTALAGNHAQVDAGVGNDTQTYIWDADDNQWLLQGSGGTETPETIKTKYESNANTNAFTDAEKTKLVGIETAADVTDAENVEGAISSVSDDSLSDTSIIPFVKSDLLKKITWANFKSALNALYAPKYGTRIVATGVSGAYTLNHSAASDWKLTLTGITTFTDSNLPTGSNTREFTMKITGSFTRTYPSYWGTIQGDAYDGTKWNFYTAQIHKGDSGSEEFTVFRTVLTA